MGQSTVDLPDPTEAPLDETAASADDLLAQLAGDEIDRLLAEAEAGAATDPLQTPQSAPPQPIEPADAAQPPATVANANPTPIPSPTADHASAGSLIAEQPTSIQPEISPAAEQPEPTVIADPQPPAPVDPSPAAPPPPQPPSAADALREELEAESDTPIGSTPAGELDAPAESPVLTETSLPDVLDEVLTASSVTAQSSVPLVLKPLEWLNRPFAFVPAETRVRLGKIGLITLLNAVAILAYVLFFRQNA